MFEVLKFISSKVDNSVINYIIELKNFLGENSYFFVGVKNWKVYLFLISSLIIICYNKCCDLQKKTGHSK